MANGLTELRQACKSVPASTEEDILKTGESVWFMGKPVEARKGMIALAQSEDMHLLIREDDILEAEKKDEHFLVKVRAEANVLARFQKAIRAGSQSCECGVDDETQPGVAQQLNQQGPWGDPIGPPFMQCRLFVNCVFHYGRWICFWWVFCPSRVGKI